MSKVRSLQATSPNAEGISDKAAGLNQIASSKKRSRDANTGTDGFAQIVNQKKQNRSANVSKPGGFTPNSQNINKAISLQDASPDAECIGDEVVDLDQLASLKKHSGNASAGTDGFAQARMRRLGSYVENAQAHSEHGVPAHSRQNVQAQSGQHVRAHSEQGTGQRVQAHSGQSFPARSQSRPDKQIGLPSQSRLHSPTQSGESTPEAQSHPSTLNVSSTAANDDGCWNLGSTQRDGRLRVEVIKKILEPSFYCSAKIREIMFENLEPTGYNWKSVSIGTKRFYFEEFKKYFVWRQSDAIIYKGWLRNARRKYSELVSVARINWENLNRRDNRIGLNVYLSWVEFWKTDDFQKKSLIQRGNRRSGVDGPSRHTSGSASHRLVAARLKLQYKRDPTADEIFFVAHTRHLKKKKYPIGEAGEDGMDDEDDDGGEVVWIDKKSERIYENFVALREQMEKAGLPVDKNALFLEAIGGPDKKNRVYGVGSSQSLFYETEYPCTSSSIAIEEENQMLKNQLTEMNDRMKAMENQLAMLIKATSVQVPANLDGEDAANFDGEDDV